jgi:hypothetical protein
VAHGARRQGNGAARRAGGRAGGRADGRAGGRAGGGGGGGTGGGMDDAATAHIDRFMAEMGLDYEMQNTLLQAASSTVLRAHARVRGRPRPADARRQHKEGVTFSLENFTASGEIWTGCAGPRLGAPAD